MASRLRRASTVHLGSVSLNHPTQVSPATHWLKPRLRNTGDRKVGSFAESVGGICCIAVVFVVESERSVDVKFIALGSIPK